MRSVTACSSLHHISSEHAIRSILNMYTYSRYHAMRMQLSSCMGSAIAMWCFTTHVPEIMRGACSSVHEHGLQPPTGSLPPTGNIVLVTIVFVSVGLIFLVGRRRARRLPATGFASGAAAAALADGAARVRAQPAGAAPPATPPP